MRWERAVALALFFKKSWRCVRRFFRRVLRYQYFSLDFHWENPENGGKNLKKILPRGSPGGIFGSLYAVGFVGVARGPAYAPQTVALSLTLHSENAQVTFARNCGRFFFPSHSTVCNMFQNNRPNPVGQPREHGSETQASAIPADAPWVGPNRDPRSGPFPLKIGHVL